MTKTVKKRLQAVVALLVSLMIMFGIVPSSALNTTVYAANTIIKSLDGSKHYVFFDLNGVTKSENGNFGTAYWNEDIKVLDGSNWESMEKVYYNAWNRYIYCYGFNTLPSSVRFGTPNVGYNLYAQQTVAASPPVENKIYQLKGNDYVANDGWQFDGTNTMYTGGASGYTTTDKNRGDEAAAQQRDDSNLAATDAKTGTYGGANITAKLYDYYSDFELINGKPRYELSQSLDTHFSNTTNDTNGGYGWGIRRYIPMLTFNDKMSAVYKSYNTAHGSESFKPMYFGEFNQVSTYNSNSTVTSWYKYDSTNGFSDANLNAGQGYKEGLYANQLDSNHRPLVAGTTSLQVPFFDTSFLRGGTQKLGIVYSTTFPFYKDSEGYYLADCAQYVYRYNDNGINATAVNGTSSNAVLGTTTSAIADADFFPFDDRSHHDTSYAVGPYADRMNYGFGMELEIPFNLVNKGTAASPVFTDDSKNDITFEFNGDDDLVVYVDDLLILDVGGTHGKENGIINFNTSQVTVQGRYTNENFTTVNSGLNTIMSNGKLTPGKHTLRVFYVERGLWESNFYMRYNFAVVPSTPTSELDISKTTTIPTADANDMWVAGSGNNTTSLASGSQSESLNDVKTLYENNVKGIEFDVRTQFATAGDSFANFGTIGVLTYDVVSGGSTVSTGQTAAVNAVGAYNVFKVKDNQTDKWVSDLDNTAGGYRLRVYEYGTDVISFEGNTANKQLQDLFTGSWTYTNKDGTETSSPSGSSNFGPTYGNTSDEQTQGYFTWQGTEDNPETVAFTNTLITKNISLQKVLSEANTSGSAKDFDIEITLSNLGGMNLEDEYTTVNSSTSKTKENTITIKRRLTVANNSTSSSIVTITGIPVLTTVKVKETTNDSTYPTKSYTMKIGTNSETNYTGDSETTFSGDTLFTITNTKAAQQVNLKLQKVWTYDMSGQMAFTSVKFKLQKQNGSTWEDVADYTLSTASGNDHVTAVTTTVDGRQQTVWERDTAIQVDSGGTYRILEYADGNTALILETDGIYAFQWKAKYNTTGTYQNQKTLSANGELAIVNDFTNMTTGMPKTGARGVYAIITFGAFAITIAGVALLIYRKKLQTVNIYAVKGSEKPKE